MVVCTYLLTIGLRCLPSLHQAYLDRRGERLRRRRLFVRSLVFGRCKFCLPFAHTEPAPTRVPSQVSGFCLHLLSICLCALFTSFGVRSLGLLRAAQVLVEHY